MAEASARLAVLGSKIRSTCGREERGRRDEGVGVQAARWLGLLFEWVRSATWIRFLSKVLNAAFCIRSHCLHFPLFQLLLLALPLLFGVFLWSCLCVRLFIPALLSVRQYCVCLQPGRAGIK